MKAKTILTTTLLSFVVVSVAIIVIKEHVLGAPAQAVNTEHAIKIEPISNAAEISQGESIVVYYFHGNMRCKTCKKIEALTWQAVENVFSGAIKEGTVVLKPVNLEKSENEHFVEDYQLINRTVVVSKRKGDQELSWRRLDNVWKLVRDEPAFTEYVISELNLLIRGSR